MDGRSFQEIRAAHPGVWRVVTLEGVRNGMAEIKVIDGNGQAVELFTILRLVELVTGAVAKP